MKTEDDGNDDYKKEEDNKKNTKYDYNERSKKAKLEILKDHQVAQKQKQERIREAGNVYEKRCY